MRSVPARCNGVPSLASRAWPSSDRRRERRWPSAGRRSWPVSWHDTWPIPTTRGAHHPRSDDGEARVRRCPNRRGPGAAASRPDRGSRAAGIEHSVRVRASRAQRPGHLGGQAFVQKARRSSRWARHGETGGHGVAAALHQQPRLPGRDDRRAEIETAAPNGPTLCLPLRPGRSRRPDGL